MRHLMDRQPSSITEAIALDFMESGAFAAHIRRRRIAYKAQRDALVEALRERLGHVLEVDVPDGGMHLIAYLKEGRSDLEVEALADRGGVAVRAISQLYRWSEPRQGLMLGFSGFPERAMAPGVARLADAIG
jgi:GntR family transcriptional regulator/MocR family aminotransferase